MEYWVEFELLKDGYVSDDFFELNGVMKKFYQILPQTLIEFKPQAPYVQARLHRFGDEDIPSIVVDDSVLDLNHLKGMPYLVLVKEIRGEIEHINLGTDRVSHFFYSDGTIISLSPFVKLGDVSYTKGLKDTTQIGSYTTAKGTVVPIWGWR
jgi:hypothetical protein